jgi:hypothetical protein
MKISKSNKTSKFSIGIVLSAVFFFALNVQKSFAIITLSKIPGVPTKPIPDIIDDLIGWILGIGLMFSVLYLVWGGINYISSTGDQQKTENARKTIKYALLGVLIIGLSYAAVLMLDRIFI